MFAVVQATLTVRCSYRYKSLPVISRRHISPHSFRHATALNVLQSGVDLSVIALWLGHEHIETTHQYMEDNLAMKKAALDSLPTIDPHLARKGSKLSDKILVSRKLVIMLTRKATKLD